MSIRNVIRDVETLVIAPGTGMNATIVPTDSLTIGLLSEVAKIPLNVVGPATPDYPQVAGEYLALRKLETHIAKSIGSKNRLELKKYIPLLAEDSISDALSQLDIEGAVWNSNDVAELLLVESISGIPHDQLITRLNTLRRCVQVGFIRVGEYVIDLAFTLRHFQPFDRIVMPGNLSKLPQADIVWAGIEKRCRTYDATATRLDSAALAFDLGPGGRTHRDKLRTKAEFEEALKETIQRFRLEGSELEGSNTEEFLPPSEAIELLKCVCADTALDISAGPATISMPIPLWASDSEKWQMLGANTANTFVTAAALLGYDPEFDTPEKFFSRVLAATGSPPLAHAFNKSYVLGGHWILQLYRHTFVSRSGGAVKGVTLNLHEHLQRALETDTPRSIVGIDIGRSKIRVARFDWDSTARTWSVNGEPLDQKTPPRLKMKGIVDCAVSLVARLSDRPSVIGVTWPGCVTLNGHVGGFSGIVRDASEPNPPYGVTTTTAERLKEFDLGAAFQSAYPQARIAPMNDMTAWGLGLWAVSSNAFNETEAAKIDDDLLAPLGAAMLALIK